MSLKDQITVQQIDADSLSGIKAIVFDRDGTLIEHVPYLSDPAQVRLLPGVKEGISLLFQMGMQLYLHSNQSGVARGYFKEETIAQVHQRMMDLIGIPTVFQSVCYATDGPGQLEGYRKPSTKFVEEIMSKANLQPTELCYIGDRWTDLATGFNAGTFAIGVATGLEDLHAEIRESGVTASPMVFENFAQVIEFLTSTKHKGDS